MARHRRPPGHVPAPLRHGDQSPVLQSHVHHHQRPQSVRVQRIVPRLLRRLFLQRGRRQATARAVGPCILTNAPGAERGSRVAPGAQGCGRRVEESWCEPRRAGRSGGRRLTVGRRSGAGRRTPCAGVCVRHWQPAPCKSAWYRLDQRSERGMRVCPCPRRCCVVPAVASHRPRRCFVVVSLCFRSVALRCAAKCSSCRRTAWTRPRNHCKRSAWIWCLGS